MAARNSKSVHIVKLRGSKRGVSDVHDFLAIGEVLQFRCARIEGINDPREHHHDVVSRTSREWKKNASREEVVQSFRGFLPHR